MSKDFNEFLQKQQEDPEFKTEYDALMADDNVQLRKYVIRAIQFENKIISAAKIPLVSRASSTVTRLDGDPNRLCSFCLTVESTGDPRLAFSVSVDGTFFVSDSVLGKQAHVKMNESLYSICQAKVCAICGITGIPPVIPPEIKFTENDVTESI